jgi:hypothetical protein
MTSERGDIGLLPGDLRIARKGRPKSRPLHQSVGQCFKLLRFSEFETRQVAFVAW